MTIEFKTNNKIYTYHKMIKGIIVTTNQGDIDKFILLKDYQVPENKEELIATVKELDI